MDTLYEMRLFTLAVRSGSFSAAGRQLGLSPASVSRYIYRLEKRLGARLLNRSSRHLSLTQAGELLLQHAVHVVNEVDDIRNAIAALATGSIGRLHIHAREFVGTHLIVPLVSQFLAQHESIDVVLSLTDQPVDLVEQRIDVSIRSGPATSSSDLSLVVRKLGASRRVICASPDYIAQHGRPTSPLDLTKHACLTYQFNLGRPLWRLRGNSSVQKIEVKSRIQSSNGEALRTFALEGLGIALMPEWSVMPDIQAGRLIQLLENFEAAPTDTPFVHNIYAVYQRSRDQSPPLKKFLQLITASFSKSTV